MKGLSRRRTCHLLLFVYFEKIFSLIFCLNVLGLLTDFKSDGVFSVLD